MKICMVLSTPFPPQEGIGYYVYHLSKRLIRRNHEITIITRGSSQVETDRWNDIQIVRVPFFPLYPFHIHVHSFFLNRLMKNLEKSFDVIHTHVPLPPVISTNLPVLCTMHGSIMGNAKAIKIEDFQSLANRLVSTWISRPLVRNHLSNSTWVTAVSKSVADELALFYGYQGATVIGNGVDENLFTPVAGSRDDNYILYVGRLDYGKGLNDLIDSAERIWDRCGLPIYIIGSGPLEAKIKEKIKKLHLENFVRLLGQIEQKELITIYQNSRIFILPSYYEGLPTVLLEAMSCGLPVIATDVSGCNDVIIDRYNGILVPPGDPGKIFEAVTMLHTDDDLRKKISNNARKTILEKFRWDTIVDGVEKCYRACVNA
jgi:glycosyltransferase involved in cell wall biosynthesis